MLPVLAGLVVIVIIFQIESSVFLSAGNLVNLLEQGAPFVLLGMAEIFVLLLGEIDLSVGYVAGVGAVIDCGADRAAAQLALVAGRHRRRSSRAAGIGVLQGMLITRLGLPSFVVTLAGLLGWEGVMSRARERRQDAPSAARSGSRTTPINNFVNGNMSPTAGLDRDGRRRRGCSPCLTSAQPVAARAGPGRAAARVTLLKIA